MARRFASWVPFYEYDDSSFFGVDAAPAPVVAARRAGFARLSALFADRFRRTVEQTAGFWLVYPKDRRRAAKIVAFRDWLTARVAEMG